MKEMFGDVRPNTTTCECDFLVISQRGWWLTFRYCYWVSIKVNCVSPNLLLTDNCICKQCLNSNVCIIDHIFRQVNEGQPKMSLYNVTINVTLFRITGRRIFSFILVRCLTFVIENIYKVSRVIRHVKVFFSCLRS